MVDCEKKNLWILKFCIKLIYPKYNFYLFCGFLAVKYRLQWNRKMSECFVFKTTSLDAQRLLCRDQLENRSHILGHKCLIISKEQFIQIACENLFYVDNNVLWVTLKLSENYKKDILHKQSQSRLNKPSKFNLSLLTSEFHKKLWVGESTDKVQMARIVPVVGSKHVQNNVIITTEAEYSNIASAFDIKNKDSSSMSFHPIPSFQCTPCIASTAEVSLLQTDYDLSNEFVKEILSNHFLIPKLIHKNDVFYINLDPDITTKHHYRYFDLVESVGRLYFQCQKINSQDPEGAKVPNVDQPYFIVKGVTQLTLGENKHLLKPPEKYFSNSRCSSKLLDLCPTGLQDKLDQIQDTITTFLSESLSDLVLSLTTPIIPVLLLSGPLGSGRHIIVRTLAKYNGMNCLQVDCNALQSSTAKQTESKISATIQKAKAAAPAIVLLDNFEVFGVDAENNEDCRVVEYFTNALTDLYQNYTKHAIIFIAVSERGDLKPNILRIFLDKFHIPKLNIKQRAEVLEWFTSVMNLKISNDKEIEKGCCENVIEESGNQNKEIIERISAKTETFIYGDLDTLLHFAMKESYLKKHKSEPQCDHNFDVLQEDDFNSALESMRSLQSQHLDAPKIPKVYWEDIGGLETLKKELLKTIEFPIKYPHLFKNSSLKRSGILLYGPPGCGKTLVAKAVSTELNVSFLSVKGPELLNMYIGQSEENVRKVFESGRASSPCIVFLDELDALAPRRGAAGDSGGAADRLVSQLLAELDGVATTQEGESSFVFVMGATNRPDLLEQSLLRPGRLDKLIYVGPYAGDDEKTSVLRALCRSHKLSEDVSLPSLAAALPARATGADLLQVVSTARASAVRRLVAQLRTGERKESELSPASVVIEEADMWEGVRSFRSSVTPDEMAYYESLQNQF